MRAWSESASTPTTSGSTGKDHGSTTCGRGATAESTWQERGHPQRRDAFPPAGGGEGQLTLEQLAAFSLLARWVDQAGTSAPPAA
jgi:hypothetical protein